jgi:hypothetical protein
MNGEGTIGLELNLEPDAYAILDRLRGDLSPSAFIQLLLRMAESGAVGPTPDTVKAPVTVAG